MDSKKLVKEVLVANINLEGIASSLIDNVVEEALKSAIEKSDTKLDDMAFQALWPKLETEVKALVSKKVAELKASLES